MTQLAVVAVGKLRPCFREACDLYGARLAKVMRFTEREVNEASRAGPPAVQRREEAVRIQRHLAPGARLVLVTRAGQAWSSRALADRVAAWRDTGAAVAVVLGGPTGADPSLHAAAVETWSLSPLTLPHELARVVVLEQLYRAWTILQGTPYHKGG